MTPWPRHQASKMAAPYSESKVGVEGAGEHQVDFILVPLYLFAVRICFQAVDGRAVQAGELVTHSYYVLQTWRAYPWGKKIYILGKRAGGLGFAKKIKKKKKDVSLGNNLVLNYLVLKITLILKNTVC